MIELTPKKLIIDTVVNKLKPLGILKLILELQTETNIYNVHVQSCEDNQKIELSVKEISVIKKLFVSKIKKEYEKTSGKEIKAIIVQIDLTADPVTFEVFVRELDNNVYKFNF